MWLDSNMILFAIIFIFIVQRIASGITANIILRNRGYESENWFVWGLIFGSLALFVALSKPEMYEPVIDDNEHSRDVLNNGGWVCSFCGSLNGEYVTSCSCGKSREETEQHIKETKKQSS